MALPTSARRSLSSASSSSSSEETISMGPSPSEPHPEPVSEPKWEPESEQPPDEAAESSSDPEPPPQSSRTVPTRLPPFSRTGRDDGTDERPGLALSLCPAPAPARILAWGTTASGRSVRHSSHARPRGLGLTSVHAAQVQAMAVCEKGGMYSGPGGGEGSTLHRRAPLGWRERRGQKDVLILILRLPKSL